MAASPIPLRWRSSFSTGFPTHKRIGTNVGLMLAHRLRRWPNMNPALGQRLNCIITPIVDIPSHSEGITRVFMSCLIRDNAVAESTLGQRHQRWPSSEPASDKEGTWDRHWTSTHTYLVKAACMQRLVVWMGWSRWVSQYWLKIRPESRALVHHSADKTCLFTMQ